MDDETRGKDYLVQPTKAQQEKFDRSQRALREDADVIDKAKEPGGRLHSMSMLRQIGTASGLYFGDNDKALPETLDDLRHYLSPEVLSWVTDNVILLTLDHLEDSAARAKAPLAYDKTLLKVGQWHHGLVWQWHSSFLEAGSVRRTRYRSERGVMDLDPDRNPARLAGL
ncbi:MAG: hypothetical protein IH892_21140 [Planctomycetes bacterium]|nr:hypothetical protein [Planctomycetota bacterium]